MVLSWVLGNQRKGAFNMEISDVTLKSVLSTQNLGVLATSGEDYPYTSLIGFVSSEDMKSVLFATMRQTRKYNNIEKHSRVSILVNSSTNSADDFKDAVSVTIMGRAVETSGDEHNVLKNVYLKKFPFLADFVNDEKCVLVKVNVDKYILVSQFQKVEEIPVR